VNLILRVVEDGAKGSVDVGRDSLVMVESQDCVSLDVDEQSILTTDDPGLDQPVTVS
jgi:hypothetical protein